MYVFWQLPVEIRARRHLKSVTESARKSEDFVEAIEKFIKLQIEDRGDLTKAIKRQKYLQIRQGNYNANCPVTGMMPHILCKLPWWLHIICPGYHGTISRFFPEYPSNVGLWFLGNVTPCIQVTRVLCVLSWGNRCYV